MFLLRIQEFFLINLEIFSYLPLFFSLYSLLFSLLPFFFFLFLTREIQLAEYFTGLLFLLLAFLKAGAMSYFAFCFLELAARVTFSLCFSYVLPLYWFEERGSGGEFFIFAFFFIPFSLSLFTFYFCLFRFILSKSLEY